jgi:hypothetical protein
VAARWRFRARWHAAQAHPLPRGSRRIVIGGPSEPRHNRAKRDLRLELGKKNLFIHEIANGRRRKVSLCLRRACEAAFRVALDRSLDPETRMSSSSSIAKFSNLLGSVRESTPDTPGAQPASDNPEMVILKLLLKGMIPVSDLVDLTQLPADVCLATVERLRSRQQVEIVEVPEQGDRKFIRLTKFGYSIFAA